LAAVILMLLSNMLSNKNFRIWRTIFSSLAAVFVIISMASVWVLSDIGFLGYPAVNIPIIVLSSFAAIFACIAAIVGAIFSAVLGMKNYVASSIIFYIAIATHILMLFI
jgi:hypothetical protein